mgnify:CR=1 FL=1
MTYEHKDIPADKDANHILHNWVYATAAARLAASGFVSGDLYKLALQSDNNTLWMLTATTPTWQLIGGEACIKSGGTNYNDLNATAPYVVVGNASDTNTPFGVSISCTVEVIRYDANNITQVAMRLGADGWAFRRKSAGTWQAWVVFGGKATQAEAEAGTDDYALMTPLRVAQAIDALAASVSVRTLNATRAMTAAAGNVNYTISGETRTPVAVRIRGFIDGTDVFSDGIYDGTYYITQDFDYAGARLIWDSRVVNLTPASGARQYATVTFISGGVRLTWAKVGSPTGTAELVIELIF